MAARKFPAQIAPLPLSLAVKSRRKQISLASWTSRRTRGIRRRQCTQRSRHVNQTLRFRFLCTRNAPRYDVRLTDQARSIDPRHVQSSLKLSLLLWIARTTQFPIDFQPPSKQPRGHSVINEPDRDTVDRAARLANVHVA